MSPIKITSLVAVALVCLAAGRATAADSNDCATCKFFAKTFQHKPEVFSKFVEFLYNPPFCSNETDCEQAREFVQPAEVLFMLLTPEENCKLMGICESDQGSFKGLVSRALESAKKSGSLMGRVLGRRTTDLAKPISNKVCALCQHIVDDIQKHPEADADLVQIICKETQDQEDCLYAMKEFLKELTTGSPTEVCARNGLCPKNHFRGY